MKQFFPIALALFILSGCAGLPGGAVATDTFALTDPPSLENVRAAPNRQVLVVEPTALKLIDSEQVVIRTAPATVQYLADAQWNDRLPRVVQAQFVQAFEDTDRLGGVGRSGDGLAIDYQLITAIRKFEVVVYGEPTAVVEVSAKILNDRNGVVRAQRVFSAAAPLLSTDNAGYIAALDAAFDQVIAEMVPWAMAVF